MIDRTARDEFSELLRNLLDGTLTTDHFSDKMFGLVALSKDRGISAVAQMADGLYSDVTDYRLTGSSVPTKEVRDKVEIALAFLNSDLEYQWPDFPRPTDEDPMGCAFFLLGLPCVTFTGLLVIVNLREQILVALLWAAVTTVTLGLMYRYRRGRSRLQRKARMDFEAIGQFAFWPFIDEAQYRRALESQRSGSNNIAN